MTQFPQDQPGQPYGGAQFPGQPYPYYPYYQPPPTFKPFRPAGTLAVATAALAIVVTVLELVEMAVAWYSGGQLQDAAADGVAASETFTAYDIVGLPVLLLLVGAWIVTALWLTQARKNAEALNPRTTHARSEVWAWLGWWVPVVSLWFPFQFVRDVRQATVAEQHGRSSIVGWWWAMFLLYAWTSQIGGRIVSTTEPDASLAGALGPVETLNAAFAVAALVFYLQIVRQITEDQDAVARGRPTAV
jgi:Domain of unknown function (DUF4328)